MRTKAIKHLAPPLEQGYPDEKGSPHALLGAILHISEKFQKEGHLPLGIQPNSVESWFDMGS
jgi:hypothetical protein